MDEPGVALLRDLIGGGVTLAVCSALVAELLHVERQVILNHHHPLLETRP